MNRFHAMALVGLLMPVLALAQRSIVVLGSSTAAGGGASSYSASWVGLTSKHFKDLKMIDTIYDLAVPGWTTLEILPTDPNDIDPSDPTDPKPDNNVSKAISYRPLPLLVIISMPSNDLVNGIPFATYLGNLRLMYNFVEAAHIPCLITSTQPRDDINPALRNLQDQAGDSILTEFLHSSVDFWDTLTDPATLGIKKAFQFGDGIHVNDAGHFALYTKILQRNILSIGLNPLPLTLISFNAQAGEQTALLTWTTADESGPIEFHIQRSADGSHYDEIASEKAEGHISLTNYSWTDEHVLAGKSFYRLRIADNGIDEYSRVVEINNTAKDLSIHRLYHPGGDDVLIADIGTAADQTLYLSIMDISGAVIRRQTAPIKAPGREIPVNTEGLSRGEYFLKIITDKGKAATAAFLQF